MANQTRTISVRVLPSKGRNYSIDTVTLTPFTFKELLAYDRKPHETYIQKLYRDIELLESDISDLDKISFFDLDALIFLKKMIGLTKSPSITFPYDCPHCNKKNSVTRDVSDINYDDVDQSVLDIAGVKLGGEIREVSIPSVAYVKKCIEKFLAYHEDPDPRIVSVSCMMKFLEIPYIKALVENATYEEILLVDQLSKLLTGSLKYFDCTCEHCRKEVKVRMGEFSSSLFQLLILNSKLPEDSIISTRSIRAGRD